MEKGPFLLIIVLLFIGVSIIMFNGLSDDRITLSKDYQIITLDPYDRDIEFDFNSMFLLGNSNNLEILNDKLVLGESSPGIYHNEGSWESPIFDTQNDYVLWDWVSADADFAGMQENLINNGGFEDISCDVNGFPAPCDYYIPGNGLVPPYVDSNSSEGSYSFRFLFDDSTNIARSYFNLGTGNWFPVNDSKVVHNVFDMKYDNDGSTIEMWYTMGPYNGWTDRVYNGAVLKYDGQFSDFTEQYLIINMTQFSNNLSQKINYAQFWFYEYYSNDDYNNTLWLDNVRIFQDSPIEYKVRTSADNVEWTEWTDSRYFVAERTAPGGQPDRYIQFNVSLKTSDNTKTPSLGSLKLDYSKAFEFKIDWLYTNDSILDPVNVEPAGTHGYVGVGENGNFVFEDGTPIRFWSIQLGDDMGNIGTSENAELMCKKIRQMGFNMIKITSPLDGGGDWDLFDNMLKSCKEEGIYVYVQLNGGWPWEVRKILPNYWNSSHSLSQKNHMRTIMEHYNPYTNTTYGEDPQFVFSQIINEHSFHSQWKRYSNGVWNDSYGVYTDMITAHFQDWIIEEYPGFSDLQNSWDEAGTDAFYSGEEIDYPNNMEIVKFEDWDSFSNKRFQDTSKFLADLHKNYYIEFRDFLVGEVGIKSLIIPNNHYYGLAELEARQVTDVIDQHSYYDHPRVLPNSGEIVRHFPQVLNPNSNIISYIALDTIGGMPMTVSESNYNYPNIYASELPLFISSYMSYHDWDQWTYFIVHTTDLMDPNIAKVPNAFTSWFDPSRMALMPASSRIFKNSYIQPGAKIINISHTQEVIQNYQYGRRDRNFNVPGLSNDFTLTNRLQIVDFDAPYEKTIEDYYNEFDLVKPASPYVSDTGELILNSDDGYLLMDAPKVQGFVGYTPKNSILLSNAEIDIYPKGNNFSSIVFVPLDDEILYNSKHILLTATGRAEASTTQWDADKRGYLDDSHCHYCVPHYGKEPMLVEGISGQMALKSSSNQLNIYVLNSLGERTGETISNNYNGGWFEFEISDMDETLWYEFVLSTTISPPTDPPSDPPGNPPSNSSSSYCGDYVCDNNESCLSCENDCGVCVFENGWELSGFEFDLSSNAVEIITVGGDYTITIDGVSEMLNIYDVDGDHIKIEVGDESYLVEFETNIELNIKGYSVYVSYLESQNGRVKLLFQNEWVRATSSFSSNSIVYLIIYAFIIFVIFFFINKQSPKIKEWKK